MIERVWALWTRRLGFNEDEEPAKPSTFRRPPREAPQLEFAWLD